MAYVAALLAAFSGFWLLLDARPLSAESLGAGLVGVLGAMLFTARLKLIDGEGAPYWRVPAMGALAVSRLAAMARAAWLVAGAALARTPKLHPALLRVHARPACDLARATFSNAVTLTPGVLAMDSEPDALLVHALVEDDSDPGEMLALENAVLVAAQPGGGR